MGRDLKTIRDFTTGVVRERRKEAAQKHGDSKASGRQNILELLMDAKTHDDGTYNDDELADHVLNFIIAGRDTTAQALSWTMFHLHQNPKIMEKLVAEIDDALGTSHTPTYEQVKSLAYANAVFHEAIRLCPSVPKALKTAVSDDVWPDGTNVPAGTSVVTATWCMARNKKIWGPDAAIFRPERWIEIPVRSQFEYPAFNAGPRVCLGKAFAELEGVFVLVSILKQYKLKVVNPEKVTYLNSLTLPIKGGLSCILTKRSAP